jgi:hypothetical protein
MGERRAEEGERSGPRGIRMNTNPTDTEVDPRTRVLALVASIGGSLVSVIAIAFVTRSAF